MKRKIALVLAAVMTTAMLPMNAMAGSTNSISKTVSVKTDEVLISAGKPVELQIQPRNEIETGDSIILSVENGKFDRSLVEDANVTINGASTPNPFIYRSNKTNTTYDQIVATGLTSHDALVRFVGNENSRQLPYGFRYINENELEVKLFPIEDSKVNQNNSSGDVTVGTPLYAIALPISTEDSTEDEEIKITIDDNGTSITGNATYVVGKVTDEKGSTTASVVQSDITVSSADSIDLPDITIKEDVAGTFAAGQVSIKTNGGYEFDTARSTPSVQPGVNAEFTPVAGSFSANKKEFIFYIGSGDGQVPVSAFDDSKLSSIVVSGLTVTTDNDSTYGDINVTVSGQTSTNITRQTIKVAERRDYGFNLVALEEVPTMYSGRTFLDDKKNEGSYNDFDQDDFTTAEFRFSETTPDTWLTSRKLELSVPEGVKIVGADITKTKYVSNTDTLRNCLAIANDGQTLRINAIGKDVLNDNEASEVEFELYLTADPTFTGDVTVTAAGAGLEADTLAPITVAKFVSPITIESAITKTNMGYQAIKTADIKITENAIAALAEDEQVEITIDSLYGENELGFADNDAKLEVSGELEAKNFKVSNGKISFTVETESYNNPATVTISDVEVGTTRSIPYGSYDLLVGGEAVVNNYLDNVDVNYPINNIEGSLDPEDINNQNSSDTGNGSYVNYGFDRFDDNEGFEFKGYLTIATETGTLDKTVEVTIGASTIKVDGEDVAMDAAAYIQTSSNSTMVPLRFVSVALGVDSDNVASADESSKIMWDNTNKTATIAYAAGNGQKLVQFTAGSPVMRIDGTDITMENGVVAEIVDGRMYVPFRALGQALGVPVSWNADTRTAIYNEK